MISFGPSVVYKKGNRFPSSCQIPKTYIGERLMSFRGARVISGVMVNTKRSPNMWSSLRPSTNIRNCRMYCFASCFISEGRVLLPSAIKKNRHLFQIRNNLQISPTPSTSHHIWKKQMRSNHVWFRVMRGEKLNHRLDMSLDSPALLTDHTMNHSIPPWISKSRNWKKSMKRKEWRPSSLAPGSDQIFKILRASNDCGTQWNSSFLAARI